MRVYALLVGINDYAPGVGKLRGSVNDAKAYRDFLTNNFSKDELVLECLLDADATRENIIKEFRNILGRAGKNDVALFQFAGHGARWKAANEFSKYFPDGFDEGLICYDSRQKEDAWDLADKELAILLHEVAQNDPHIAVVMDCCHSGSGTRSADQARQLVPRTAHTVKTPRPLESYLDQYYLKQQNANGTLVSPSSRHMLMAGCDRYGLSYECRDMHRGVFSATLLDAIDKIGLNVSYADLFLRVRSLVRHKAIGQNPQFEAFEGFNAWSGFLNRLASTRGRRFSIRYNISEKGFDVDCGAIHGLPEQMNARAEFQLFGDDDSDEVIGHAVSTSVGLNTCAVEGNQGTELDWQKVYSAELTSVPKPQLDVFLSGDSDAIALMLTACESCSTVFNWERESISGLSYGVEASPNGFRIYYAGTEKLIQNVKGTASESCEYVIQVLNRVANWQHALLLQNNSPSVDPSVVDFVCQEVCPTGEVIDHCQEELSFDIVKQPNGQWSEVSLRFAGRNKTRQKLHMMLVWFDEAFGINVLNNNPHEEEKDLFSFQLNSDQGIAEEIGFFLGEDEGDQLTQTFKLFVSKDKIEDFLLAQPPLQHLGETIAPQPTSSRGTRFKRKIKEVTWFTRTIQINLNRQRAQVGKEARVLADGQIRIKPHPAVTAGASLLPVVPGSRGVGSNDGFTLGLAEQGFELLNFSKSRGENQSVLEFSDIQNRESLAEQPLHLELDVDLQENEHVVPIVFDGEHLLLAGETWKDESGKTQVQIDRIPDSASGGRSAFSAFKLYFFKALCGLDNVGELCSYEFNDDGTVRRSKSGLGERVHKAEKVLVLVHGLFGDSQAMAREISRLMKVGQEKVLPFDLVLGYDYETINTPLEESARKLKDLLKAKGIDSSSNKHITIVAHSMGGLVSRWMIEKEAGNQFVDHLLMCGTPNEGSPFGSFALAASAINNLANMAMNLIPGFAKLFIQSAQKTLADRSLTTCIAQMAANSEFLTQLNTSDDPGVRYTIVAGNLDDYVATESDTRFQNLLTKIGGSDGFQKLFGGLPHDVAVSVDSMRAVLDSRSPQPSKTNLPCHHLNYLFSEPGWECLRGIDWFNEIESS